MFYFFNSHLEFMKTLDNLFFNTGLSINKNQFESTFYCLCFILTHKGEMLNRNSSTTKAPKKISVLSL